MQTRFVLNPITGELDLVNVAASPVSGSNYILNPNAEVDVTTWNLYNDSGRTVPASLINQDITFTSTLSGDGGNGVEIEYIYNAAYPSSTPNINVISSTYVQVRWNNGPTVANNPSATQLAAAWNAVPAATAIATIAITGTPSKLQYIVGAEFLAFGGDTAPTDGIGGTPTGLTLVRSTVNPIVGLASFVLSKDAANREGEGVSTDFTIDNLYKGATLEVSFSYDGSSGMVLGASSDLTVWIYDITNNNLIPVVPKNYLAGPTGTIHTFVGTFTASPISTQYRLIFHISTQNTNAWTFQYDQVVVTSSVVPAITQVQTLVLQNQLVNGSVTDRMCVMWRDGATQWVPATIAGAALPMFGTDTTQLGFATNIVSGHADIYIRGYMDGFSFGPFAGYDQFLDNVTGGISPLPSPFTDMYVSVGMAISSTVLNIQFEPHLDQISNGSGVPLKGGLLTNSGVNDGTGDQVLAVGTNGQVPVANSAAVLGIQWAAPIVATTPFTFTSATRTLTIATATDSVAGVMSAADHTALTADTAAKHNAVTLGTANGLSLATQVLSLAAATDTTPGAMAAADHAAETLNTAARHNAVTIGTANGLSLATQALSLAAATNSVPGALTAADHTTYSGYAATIALKAPLASPTFTGGVIISTTTGALTLPKLTTTQVTALTAVEGMLVYNTTLHKMQIRTASTWETVTSA